MAKDRLADPRPIGRPSLERPAGPAVRGLPSIDALVARLRPSEPILCLRPAAVLATARRFVAAFPGDVLYAVKCNPEPRVLRLLWSGGVRHFDCASPSEVALVRRHLPAAEIHFMHPVKARPAIREAYRRYAVNDFALDSFDELEKILQETVPVGLVGDPPRLGLFVRLSVAGDGAVLDLSGKFGVGPEEAARLLRAARPHAARLGISFHVGSQCLDPGAYARAVALAREAVVQARVAIDILDVGGGFPVNYAAADLPPLGDYVAAIAAACKTTALPSNTRLWAEPGRALVAAGASLIVQVQLRRGDALYVNDGIYGNLSDAGRLGWHFPARRIRLGEDEGFAAPACDFRLFGPTCDSADQMPGPFRLPADTDEGDWIELGQLGAYGAALRTGFNGFGRAELYEVADPPMLMTPGYEE
jgi:ornithine decarboxylase